MRSIFKYLATALILILTASCSKETDNYAGPTETLKGAITDSATGKPLQTEVSGDNGKGARVKLLETSWSDTPEPLYLACKQDGTYINTKVFAATYNISVEGAFVPLLQVDKNGGTIVDKTKNVKVQGGTTTVDFQVQPFLNIEWAGDPVLNADSTITVKGKITRGTTNPSFQQNITDVFLFVNNTEYIGNNNFDSRYSVQVNFSGSTGNTILGRELSLTTKGRLPTQRDVFVRIGARIDYGLKYYNYSEPKKLAIP